LDFEMVEYCLGTIGSDEKVEGRFSSVAIW
jgi:hypothetical protein